MEMETRFLHAVQKEKKKKKEMHVPVPFVARDKFVPWALGQARALETLGGTRTLSLFS